VRDHVLNANSRDVWDRVWESDAYAAESERSARATKRIADFALDHPSREAGFILDIGCGSGALLRALRRHGASGRLVGLDRSSRALACARKYTPDGDIIYVRGHCTLLPFSDDSFDVVTAFGVLEHVREHAHLLDELQRVMKEGGSAYLSSSNACSVLQILNRAKSAVGRYPYGYQRNWTIPVLAGQLQSRFEIQRTFVSHAADDMPAIAAIDKFVAQRIPEWGRYICFVLRKRGRDGRVL
jgi:ubiquinone/menaquinone biosynthesis C-methylase UbiE